MHVGDLGSGLSWGFANGVSENTGFDFEAFQRERLTPGGELDSLLGAVRAPGAPADDKENGMNDETMFEWGELPPKGTSRGRKRNPVYDQIAERLQQRPGQWAKVCRSEKPNMMDPLRDRGCVLRQRTVHLDDGTTVYDTWASWPAEAGS